MAAGQAALSISFVAVLETLISAKIAAKMTKTKFNQRKEASGPPSARPLPAQPMARPAPCPRSPWPACGAAGWGSPVPSVSCFLSRGAGAAGTILCTHVCVAGASRVAASLRDARKRTHAAKRTRNKRANARTLARTRTHARIHARTHASARAMTRTRARGRGQVLSIGLANIMSGALGGIPATAALARTALNIKSGAKSRSPPRPADPRPADPRPAVLGPAPP